jgi:hypothetical protein
MKNKNPHSLPQAELNRRGVLLCIDAYKHHSPIRELGTWNHSTTVESSRRRYFTRQTKTGRGGIKPTYPGLQHSIASKPDI